MRQQKIPAAAKAKTQIRIKIRIKEHRALGKGHESEKKTPLNKLKNQIAAVTGDEARPMLYVLAAIAAAAVVISVTVIRRKNK